MEISRGEYVWALVWFNRFMDIPDIVECHACSTTAARGRWMDRNFLGCFWDVLATTKARACVAQITSPAIERIWRRMGFTILGPAGIAIVRLTMDKDTKSNGQRDTERATAEDA